MAKKKYEVIGPLKIAGVDPGESIELDPDDQTPGAINVQALISAGHIKEAKSSPAAKSSTASDKGK